MTKYYNKKKQKRNGTLLLSAIMLMVMMFSLTAPWSASPTYAKDFNPNADRTMAGKDGEALVGLLGNEPEAARHGKKLKRKDTNEDLSFSISLKPRNSGDLDKLIVDLSDPTSPRYHKFLTPPEFAAQFGATRAEVSTLATYLNSKGLKVDEVAPNGLSVKVKGKVAQAEAAFNTQISDYSTAKGEKYFANDSQIALPTRLTGLVNGVHLDTEPKARPALSSGAALTSVAMNNGPTIGYTPAQIRNAYNINLLLNSGFDGTGQSIALYELDGFIASNFDTFNNYFGLPNQAGWLETVLVDGFDGKPVEFKSDGEAEVEMDVEIAHSVAPAAKILVYAGPNTSQGTLDTYQKIASENRAKLVSTSWGGCELSKTSATMNALHAIFQQMAVQGQSVFAYSGDNGAYACSARPSDPNANSISVQTPANDPLVTAVGGTDLQLNANGDYISETAWGDSGGGVSTVYARPFYQDGLFTLKRMVPDVAAAATSDSYAIFVLNSWTHGGGTSASAPLWAAIAALNNQYRATKGLGNLGLANPALYQMSRCDDLIFSVYGPASGKSFHDITVGNNNGYQTGPGADPVTGLGSPNAFNLVHNLNDANSPCALLAPTQQGASGDRLQNGSFEQGSAFWTEYSSGGAELVSKARSHGGSWSAYLGGYNNAIESVRQSVSIPAYAQKAALTFWVKIETTEVTTSSIFDAMTTEISYQDASGVAHTFIPKKLSNLDAAAYGNWKQVTIDLTSLKGMSNMELKFRATTDGSLPSSFFVDDVELVTVNI